MATFLVIVGWVLFGLGIVAGLVLDLVGLFGNWVILATIGIAWIATGFKHFGVASLTIMLGFAVLGEVLEFVAAGYGVSRFGGSRGAAVAAVLGCLVGAMVGTGIFPILGTVAGACLGALVFAVLYEYLARRSEAGPAIRAGLGAALGRVAGLFIKLFMGFAILVTAALTY